MGKDWSLELFLNSYIPSSCLVWFLNSAVTISPLYKKVIALVFSRKSVLGTFATENLNSLLLESDFSHSSLLHSAGCTLQMSKH